MEKKKLLYFYSSINLIIKFKLSVKNDTKVHTRKIFLWKQPQAVNENECHIFQRSILKGA